MTDTKMRTLDRIQLNRQKLNFQSHPKPTKQFVSSLPATKRRNTNRKTYYLCYKSQYFYSYISQTILFNKS